jgi:hypothetical protein
VRTVDWSRPSRWWQIKVYLSCHPILCRGPLIIRLIIHTILLYPSRAVWIDEASNVSRPDPSGANQIDAEHQATDLAVGVRIPRGAHNAPGQQTGAPCFACLLIILRRRVTPSDRLEPVEAHQRTSH